MNTYTLDRDTSNDLRELMEDSIEFFCDNYMISGELAWIVVETIAQAKIAQMRGEIR